MQTKFSVLANVWQLSKNKVIHIHYTNSLLSWTSSWQANETWWGLAAISLCSLADHKWPVKWPMPLMCPACPLLHHVSGQWTVERVVEWSVASREGDKWLVWPCNKCPHAQFSGDRGISSTIVCSRSWAADGVHSLVAITGTYMSMNDHWGIQSDILSSGATLTREIWAGQY